MKNAVTERQLTRLYETYSGAVYGFAYSIIGSRSLAEDALQETFTKAITNVDFSMHEKAIKSWLFVTARNVCLDMLRKDKYIAGSDDLLEYQGVTEDRDEIIMLNDALKKLSDKQRQVVMLHMAGFKYAQIGAILGMPSGTVGWVYSEAKKTLKSLMARS